MILSIHGILPRYIDPDATAFITASGITDNTQKYAINYLVTALKVAGLWSSFVAIYPFVGGTASTHKWNLKDPRDLDAAFRLDFTGGWTHSSTGANHNGIDAFANSHATCPNVFTTSTLAGISYYSRTPGAAATIAAYIMGAANSGTPNFFGLTCRRSNDNALFVADFNPQSSYRNAVVAVSDANGLFTGVQQGNHCKLFKNGSEIAADTTAQTAPTILSLTGLEIYIGAINDNGSAAFFSARECAFSAIHYKLTDAQSTELSSIVQSYQTILGRQV